MTVNTFKMRFFLLFPNLFENFQFQCRPFWIVKSREGPDRFETSILQLP